jgi:hypothetical protein
MVTRIGWLSEEGDLGFAIAVHELDVSERGQRYDLWRAGVDVER